MFATKLFDPIMRKHGHEWLYGARSAAIGVVCYSSIGSLMKKHGFPEKAQEEILKELAYTNHLQVSNFADYSNLDSNKLADVVTDVKSLIFGTLQKVFHGH